jgi:RNA polymerase sigma-70 factor, ECF subfamily
LGVGIDKTTMTEVIRHWQLSNFVRYQLKPREFTSSTRPVTAEKAAKFTSHNKVVETVSLDVLMAKIVDGDTRAFENFYRQLAPRIRGFLRVLSGDERVAEDVTQTTFLKIFRARDTYQLGAPVEPWVFAIARRTLLDHRRARRRRPEDLSVDGSVPERAVFEEAVEGFERLDAGTLDALNAGLQRLPDAQREAIMLLKVQGLSVAEAAQIAGVAPGALKVRAHRAYEALRKAIGIRKES